MAVRQNTVNSAAVNSDCYLDLPPSDRYNMSRKRADGDGHENKQRDSVLSSPLSDLSIIQGTNCSLQIF